MKKKVANNISLKILSLIIAVVVWLLVVNIDNPIGTKSFVVSDVQLLNEAYMESAFTTLLTSPLTAITLLFATSSWVYLEVNPGYRAGSICSTLMWEDADS